MSTPRSGGRLPLWIIIMGVAGSGKSTLGQALARRLGWEFIDADDLHPCRNVEKMSRGVPLTDADRAPWLRALSRRIIRRLARGCSGVLACSALKAAYRQKLRVSPAVLFVYLKGAPDLLEGRLRSRSGHFMPPALLESQFADLEEPPDALTLDAAQPVSALVEQIRHYFGI